MSTLHAAGAAAAAAASALSGERPEAPRPPDADLRDLGFGARVADQTRGRLLNPDGSFNSVRNGLPFLQSLSLYHALLCISWPKFYAVLVGLYLGLNLLFAAAFFACGPGALAGGTASSAAGRFQEAFFFSVQTLATIGYGKLTPEGLASNVLVTLEALVGIVGFSVATGLAFARLSRPSARVLFSRKAVVAPYRGGRGLMFRVVNVRTSQLLEVQVKVVLSRQEGNGRRFAPLRLERDSVMFFPLHWTVVHPIDEQSPLFGVTEEELRASGAELLILLTATDETFSQVVHTRASYRAEEIAWGVRFRDMFEPSADGRVAVDVRRLHDVEPA